MKRLTKAVFIFSFFSACLPVFASGPAFDIIPLWGIKVNYEGLQYNNISVKTEDASAIVNNNVPQNLKFRIVIEKPTGFTDSAGFVKYGCELNFGPENSKSGYHNADIFTANGLQSKGDLNDVSIALSFDAQTKPNTKIKLIARLFDKLGNGSILIEYNLLVVAGAKRLPPKILSYSNKDSKGMRSNSVGLHFNFFEFVGLQGNNFLYRIKKTDKINFTLKGLEGWKISEGKAAPVGELTILNEKGEVVETKEDVLEGTVGKSIPSNKKELEIKYKTSASLESGKMYFAWLKLKDRNSPKNVLDLVVKFYID